MNKKDKDALIQGVVQIKRNIEEFEINAVDLRAEIKSVEMKIADSIIRLEREKDELVAYIDDAKAVIINMPVEEPKPPEKPKTWLRYHFGLREDR